MKIGILTVPFNNNYGGYLQTYALMTALRLYGHTPIVIMRRQNIKIPSLYEKSRFFIHGLIKRLTGKSHAPLLLSAEEWYFKQGKSMHTFVAKYMCSQTRYLYSSSSFSKLKGKFEAIIVGSDQVWRAIYVPNVEDFYLDFARTWNIKRIAYAASFGTTTPEYTKTQIESCGKLVSLFDAISLREYSGKEVFDNFGWKSDKIEIVLDPTLLFDKSFYHNLLSDEASETRGKIFCYVLDKTCELTDIVNYVSDNLALEIYEISDIQNYITVLPSVERWLESIRDSEFVITDSFHGTIFSIIFNKPFIVFSNANRGRARFDDLLNLLGIDGRIVTNLSDINNCINNSIDWEVVNTRINKLRKNSFSFLERNLD